MIGIDIIRKKRKTGGTGGGSVGSGISTPSGGDAQNAVHADDADHANRADEATHAASAKELDGGSSVWNTIRTWISGATDAMKDVFLRKDQDDETKHKLTMGEAEVTGDAAVKGDLKIGADGSYTISKDGIAKLAGVVAEYLKSSDFHAGTGMGFDGQGYGITKGTDGRYTLEIDNFIARMKMIVAELEVHEMSFIGGTVVMSTCGNRVDRVEALDAKGICIADAYGTKPTLVIPEGKTVERFRCYFLASDGDRQIKNEWTVGQLARAKTNNIAKPGDYTDYQNRDYWRLVVGVSSAPKTIEGKQYHWIDLSNSTSGSIKLTDAAGTTWYYGYGGASQKLNSLPFAGDNIIGMGHGWDETKQGVAIFSVSFGGWAIYKGINHYDLPDANIVNLFSIKKSLITTDNFILRPYAAPEETQTVAVVRGEYSDTASYGHNDMVTYEGQTWIASGVAIGETIKGTEPSATSAYWSLAAAKGIQGETPTFAKLRVDHSALHYNPTTDKWDYDSVTVSIVIFTPEGTKTPGINDVSEYYWLLDNDTTTKRASKWGFSATTDAASHTATLYKVGSNEAIDAITVPMVRDGEQGKSTTGAAATVYTIEPCANFEATGKLTDGSTVEVSISGDVQVYKTIGDKKTVCGTADAVYDDYFRLSMGGSNYDGTKAFTLHDTYYFKVSKTASYEVGKDTIPGSATISLYDLISGNTVGNQLASLVVPVSLNPGAIVDVNSTLSKIQNTTTSMQNDMDGMKGTIETIQQGQGQISLKVQDLQNGGIDTGKPHTSTQVDFTTLDSDNFYPVMIKFNDDDGVRHTVEIDRPLNAAYGSEKGYMAHGQGFSFRLVFSDIANAWGSYEDGQLRIESISQRWTTPSDTPICPKIAQYNVFSFMVVWLRGGSKYDVTVDCSDAYISGIWPYMMQVASDPSWVPDAVRLANDTWTTAQINAQAGSPYNLLKHDSDGYYADVTNEYLYRFGSLTAGNAFAIVGQPTDSKQWFMATWHITNVSGSKVYVDTSTYGITWQAQNPLGIRMNGILGYIKICKIGESYAKSKWDSQDGFGSSVNVDNTDVHANWVTTRPILVIGKESSATDGVYRDRAVLENVNSCTEGSSVSFSSGTYFDISPLYGTDGRVNVKTDMLATGIDIKSHKITLTANKTVFRTNSGKEIAVFSGDGINADLIHARTLSTIGKDGNGVLIENAMATFFGKNRCANIKFGVNSDGYAVLSYYDNDGKPLYDLGPKGITAKDVKESSINTVEGISANVIAGMKGYSFSTSSDTGWLHCVPTDYEYLIFGGRADDRSAVYFTEGYTPTNLDGSQTLYQYHAAYMSGTPVRDPAHGLDTADLAKAADGKYFTGETMGANGALTHLANGSWFLGSYKTWKVSDDSGANHPYMAIVYAVFDAGFISTKTLYTYELSSEVK
jgi:hypothetical protein